MMRAVLLATGYVPNMDVLLQHRPTPLLNVCDRPIIFHIIESLHDMNISAIDIILYHMPAEIEHQLGNGERWGVDITYHIAKDIENPLETLIPAAEVWEDGLILVGQGDVLPLFLENTTPTEEPIGYYFPNREWSGWALITTSMLKNLPSRNSVESLLKEEGVSYRHVEVEPFLSGRGFLELHDSNINALNPNKTPLLFPSTASMVEPGIWISRAVSLHPTVKIHPPVFIGTDTNIHEGVIIGPNSVVERNCVIDKNSVIKDSVVCQQSYVGEGLTLNQTIVDRNLLINVALDTKMIVKDGFILDELVSAPVKWSLIYFTERIVALLLFILNLPFYLALKLLYDIKTDKMLHLPVSSNETNLETFEWYYVVQYREGKRSLFLNYSKNIPNLLNIIKGYAHFVGSAPRSPKDTSLMPTDWKKLYMKSKIGLITLAGLEIGENPSPEEIYASEVYYAVHMGGWYDLRIFARWLWKKIKNFCIHLFRIFK